VDWKYLTEGEPHEKDFTVYLGSYTTIIAFVNALENDPTIEQLDTSKAGSADRIVGDSGKIGARFDPRGQKAGRLWTKGWDGIPFEPMKDFHLIEAGKRPQDVTKRPRSVLKAMFGDYFLPQGID
jgi:hypothetical protein